MKIVDVSEFYAEHGGGVRTYTEQKLAAARRLGHELVVLAPGPTNREERRAGGRIIWLKSPRFPLDKRYHVFTDRRALSDVLARERPDVIEGSSVWSGGWFVSAVEQEALKALVFHQDPVAVYGHTFLDGVFAPARIDQLFRGYWGLLQRLSQRYDVTVTASRWLAERLTQRGLSNVRAVEFGCDLSPFGPEHEDPTLRAWLLARTETPTDGDLLIAVSRHHPEKRLHVLCEAVQRLRRTRPVGLVIFGDGPLRSWVERWARKAGGVYVAGYSENRAELARCLASADAFVHGSAAETYGIAVAEALSAGLPVVVPERGGAAELSRPAYSERYTVGDASACADAIARLLSRPRSALRAAARLHAGSELRDLAAHFCELFALYDERIRERRRGAAPS